MKEDAKVTAEPDVLQERVFVASLIRVLTDVLGSAKDLYHRLKQKSSSDDEQDASEKSQHESSRDRRDSHSNIIEAIGRHVRWSLDQRARHHGDGEDDIVCNAAVQVQTTYDRAYRKLGESYARGDDLAKIELQAHIIKLQQVLISIHQDLMLSNYLTISSSHSQLIHLVQTVRTTRGAAIQVLDLLYQRMLAPPPKTPPKPGQHSSMPGTFPPPARSPPRSRSSSPNSSNTSLTAPLKPAPLNPQPKPIPKPNPNINKLFCRYALDLQHNAHLPLSSNFSHRGNKRCPHCNTYVPTRPGKAWEVIMESGGRHPKRRRFLVKNAFVVKCHRGEGGFACALCARWGDADTVCQSAGALMEHLWREHSCGDLERDGDIVGC